MCFYFQQNTKTFVIFGVSGSDSSNISEDTFNLLQTQVLSVKITNIDNER
jgi:hypothetical protein